MGTARGFGTSLDTLSLTANIGYEFCALHISMASSIEETLVSEGDMGGVTLPIVQKSMNKNGFK